MVDILHRIIIEASPEDVYQALTDQNKLSEWWTTAQTNGELGSVASFFLWPQS